MTVIKEHNGAAWETVLVGARGPQGDHGNGYSPPGVTVPFAGDTPPDGWLWANGQEVSRTQYAILFTAIGTVFGSGDGTTTFNVPDLRGRTAIGLDNLGGAADAGRLSVANTLGGSGGSETVALTPAQTPLRAHTHSGTTGTESADHTHSGTTNDPDTNHSHSGTTNDISLNHTHYLSGPLSHGDNRLINTTAGTSYAMSFGAGGWNTGTVSTGHTHGFDTGMVSAWHKHAFGTGGRSAVHTHSFTTGNPSVAEANGAAHENLPPYLLTNWIISTGALYQPVTVSVGTARGFDFGDVKATARADAPSGWALCNGQTLSRTAYSDLFAAIGTTYGAGDGSTTFAVPDLRGRVIAGRDAMGAALSGRLVATTEIPAPDTLGSTGGAQTHALVAAETPLRAHTHSGTTGNDSVDHSHAGTTANPSANHVHGSVHGNDSYGDPPFQGGAYAALRPDHYGANINGDTVSAWHTHTMTTGGRSAFHTHSFTTGNPSVAEANGTAHNNMQPTMLLNYVIYHGATS